MPTVLFVDFKRKRRSGRFARRAFWRGRRSERFAVFALAGMLCLAVTAMFARPAQPGTALPRPGLEALRVVDGDTLEVRTTGERLRLLDLDTPERGRRASCAAERDAAERASRALEALLRGGAVRVHRTGSVDAYGRTLARVSVDGTDVAAALRARGLGRPWRGRREPWCGADGALLAAR